MIENVVLVGLVLLVCVATDFALLVIIKILPMYYPVSYTHLTLPTTPYV